MMERSTPLTDAERDEVITVLRRECGAGNMLACHNLGSAYAAGRLGEADPTAGLPYLEQGCALGLPLSCADLGWMYRNGEGVERDPERAFSFTEKSCVAGWAVSCGELAEMLVSGFGVSADPQRARTLMSLACQEGQRSRRSERRFCTQLGGMCEQGVGGPVALDLAEVAYSAACRRGDVAACGRLPYVVKARGELPRALEIAEGLCSQGLAMPCAYAGQAHATGSGCAADAEAAAGFYRQACAEDLAIGCAALGLLLTTSEPHSVEGKAALQRGCTLGAVEACTR